MMTKKVLLHPCSTSMQVEGISATAAVAMSHAGLWGQEHLYNSTRWQGTYRGKGRVPTSGCKQKMGGLGASWCFVMEALLLLWCTKDTKGTKRHWGDVINEHASAPGGSRWLSSLEWEDVPGHSTRGQNKVYFYSSGIHLRASLTILPLPELLWHRHSFSKY